MAQGSWEEIYKKQGEVQFQILNTVVEAKNIFEAKGYHTILDLGCGTGRNSIYLASHGFNLYACDISSTAIEIAEANSQELDIKNIKYDIEDMYSLTYSNDFFDAILCVWVQGHGLRDEIKKSIYEQFRVLKEGGMIITDFVTVEDDTYGVGEEIELNTFVGGRKGEENIPHYYTTLEELDEWFEGFSEVEIFPRIYTFNDKFGNEHMIHGAVVKAVK